MKNTKILETIINKIVEDTKGKNNIKRDEEIAKIPKNPNKQDKKTIKRYEALSKEMTSIRKMFSVRGLNITADSGQMELTWLWNKAGENKERNEVMAKSKDIQNKLDNLKMIYSIRLLDNKEDAENLITNLQKELSKLI